MPRPGCQAAARPPGGGNGDYELVNGGNTSLVLDLDVASGRVQVWTAAYDANQQWG